MYVDEDCLLANDLAQDFVSFSSFLDTMHQTAERPSIREYAYLAQVAPDITLADLLFVPGYMTDDIRFALMAQIDALPKWDINGDHADRSTREYLVERASARIPVLAVVLPPFGDGGQDQGVFIASSENGLRRFVRALFELADIQEGEFIAASASAFPRLIFKKGIEREIRRFSRPYRQIRTTLVAGLSALNDQLIELLDAGTPILELGPRLEAATGFGLSPESPQTHRNQAAMRARDVTYNGQTFRCEWHLKLEPHRDRIHFHLYDPRIGDGNKLLIGIFTDHLPT